MGVPGLRGIQTLGDTRKNVNPSVKTDELGIADFLWSLILVSQLYDFQAWACVDYAQRAARSIPTRFVCCIMI